MEKESGYVRLGLATQEEYQSSSESDEDEMENTGNMTPERLAGKKRNVPEASDGVET